MSRPYSTLVFALCLILSLFQRVRATEFRALPEWGQPVGAEPFEWPELPSGRGWARALTTDMDVIAAGDGVVVAGARAWVGSKGFRLTDGAVLWVADSYDLPASEHPQNCILDNVLVAQSQHRSMYFGSANIVAGTSVRDGRLLWRSNASELLAVNAAGVWVGNLDEGVPSYSYNPDNVGEKRVSNVRLLDLHTGAELNYWPCGKLWATPAHPEQEAENFAVLTADEVLVMDAAGGMQRTPRARPGWHGVLAVDNTAVYELTSASAPDYTGLTAEMDQLGITDEDARAAYQQNSEVYRAANTVELRAYALPGLSLLWEKLYAPAAEGEALVAPAPPRYGKLALTPTAVLGIEYGTLVSVSRADGSPLPAPITLAEGFGVTVKNGYLLTWNYNGVTDKPPALVWELGTDLTYQLPPNDEGFYDARSPWVASDGWLCYRKQRGTGGGIDYSAPDGTALIGLDLTAHREGQLQLLDMPEDFHELTADFLADPAPLENAALMKRIVSGGQAALHRLFLATPVTDGVHLDALVRAVNYIAVFESLSPWSSHARLLMGYHLERLGPALEPQLLAWLADPHLASMQLTLENCLLRAGGAAGQEYFVARYARHTQEPLRPAVWPWRLSLPQSAWSDPAKYEIQPEYAQTQSKSVDMPDGGKLTAFTGFGHVDFHQILLGLDRDGDGRMEAVWPTGIEDRCCQLGQYSQSQCFCTGEGLTLELALPTITVGHHKAQFGLDEEANEIKITGATYTRTNLNLDQLQLDADGDGLSDLQEQQMLLNPSSADTDGDGIADAVDPAPNANASGMGQLERGIERFLMLYERETRRHQPATGNGTPSYGTLPVDAIYIVINGAGAVARGVNGQRTIYVTDEKQRWSMERPELVLPSRSDYYVQVHDREEESYEYSGASPDAVIFSFSLEREDWYNAHQVELVLVDGELYPLWKEGR